MGFLPLVTRLVRAPLIDAEMDEQQEEFAEVLDPVIDILWDMLDGHSRCWSKSIDEVPERVCVGRCRES